MDQTAIPKMQDLDETEETLSLCDLPLYGDVGNWEDFCKEDQSSSSSSEDDYFEFFSAEWSSSTTAVANACPANKSIVFCGKLIPNKDPLISIDTKKTECQRQDRIQPKKRGLFLWKSGSLSKLIKFSKSDSKRDLRASNNNNRTSKMPCISSSKSLSMPASEKHKYGAGKFDYKNGFPVGRVSVVAAAAPCKSRWFLFMFGLAKFPTDQMDMSDMRNRQRRRGPSTLFRSDSGAEKVGVSKSSWKEGWGLMRVFGRGTGSGHANAVVKAPFACIPPV